MLSTPASRRRCAPRPRGASRWFGLLLSLAALSGGVALAQSPAAPADPKPAGDAQFAKRFQERYEAAKASSLADTNSGELKWRLARACFDFADYAATDKKRAEISEEGIAVCRALIQARTNLVQAHYYLALNLGQLARTKSWGALKLVGQMEDEFKTVLSLDPKFDYAGADRGLGLLYLDAPGWPLSIGSKSKAREHLQKAAKDTPEYPENKLDLVEAYLKWSDKKAATLELQVLADLWPKAREKFAGEDWTASWSDWEKRRAAALKKLGSKVAEK